MSSTEANGSVDVGCFVPFYSFANITLLFETQIDCSRVQSYYFDIEIVSKFFLAIPIELQVELSIFLYHRRVPGCNYQCIYVT